MGIIMWIVFGFVVGLVARFVMPGRDPLSLLMTTILGIVGALVAGFLGRALGWYQEGEPAGFLMAVVGAVALLALFRAIRKPRPTGVH
jgi:uncharacterized membrane protein YeaQ/YmgE (transglycosylase-associated protein family)